jgi:endonuclease/exonuclease/phosphatase (EEP) superfamily protein YafD
MEFSRVGRAFRMPKGGVWRVLLLMLAVVLLGLSGLGLVAHVRTPHRGWLIGVSALAPYFMFAAVLALVGFAVIRLWLGVLVAALLTLAGILTQVPLYVASSPMGASTPVVVMTSNLRLGHASPAAVVDAVRGHHVDVLTLEELTPDELQRLGAAGLNRLLPYSASDPRPSAAGVGLWSRYPLTDKQTHRYFKFSFVTAKAAIPGTGGAAQLVALHMPGPWPQPSGSWLANIGRLPSVLRDLGGHGAVLVGGDFNATQDVGQFRRLLVDGYRDAAEQSGAGITRTFPSDRWYPPLLAIDHVLTRDAVAQSADTVQISGSDHRALLVTVAVPRAD